jgi:hypothetical protein
MKSLAVALSFPDSVRLNMLFVNKVGKKQYSHSMGQPLVPQFIFMSFLTFSGSCIFGLLMKKVANVTQLIHNLTLASQIYVEMYSKEIEHIHHLHPKLYWLGSWLSKTTLVWSDDLVKVHWADGIYPSSKQLFTLRTDL